MFGTIKEDRSFLLIRSPIPPKSLCSEKLLRRRESNPLLILTRKKGQSILLGNNIEIFISAVDGDQVKIGIEAPKDITILRKEYMIRFKKATRKR
ncbi:carbon storage regulator [Gordoniibacillus kamchatkensis]|uniref:carbon storage regulator n=1 Tax=Gordoniibacillus kamchatkensis TaxID=1590651 RepID=UPI002F3EC71E